VSVGSVGGARPSLHPAIEGAAKFCRARAYSLPSNSLHVKPDSPMLFSSPLPTPSSYQAYLSPPPPLSLSPSNLEPAPDNLSLTPAPLSPVGQLTRSLSGMGRATQACRTCDGSPKHGSCDACGALGAALLGSNGGFTFTNEKRGGGQTGAETVAPRRLRHSRSDPSALGRRERSQSSSSSDEERSSLDDLKPLPPLEDLTPAASPEIDETDGTSRILSC
jgi:hypothetical protein